MFAAYYSIDLAWLDAAAAVVGLGLLAAAWPRLRGTTLTAPLFWCAAAGAGLLPVTRHGFGGGYAHYTAAVLLVAPTLALLGAKRPQNGAWQFIVVTLLCVLLLPVGQGLAFGDGEPHVHALFSWVIAAHIVVGVVNYLPTRYGRAALLFGAAQFLAAAEFLPGGPYAVGGLQPWAACCLAAAALSATLDARRAAATPPSLDRLWRDFRDAYGLVWGLRIAERLNAAAAQHGWPVEFTWGGMLLREGTSELDADLQHRIERELRSHLRRFVSHDWIARRLHGDASS